MLFGQFCKEHAEHFYFEYRSADCNSQLEHIIYSIDLQVMETFITLLTTENKKHFRIRIESDKEGVTFKILECTEK